MSVTLLFQANASRAIIMCYGAFAAKSVAYCDKVKRSEVPSHQARTMILGSDEADISWWLRQVAGNFRYAISCHIFTKEKNVHTSVANIRKTPKHIQDSSPSETLANTP